MAHEVYFWWGLRYHYDHCMCQQFSVDLAIGTGGVAAVGAAIAIAAPIVGVGAAIIAAYIQVMMAQISAYDNECANATVDHLQGGVFLCMSWAAPGVFWIAKVC